MQSFGDFFANNRILAVGILLAAVAVILAVGIALFRLVFGRRLHMSGGRTRQPRLGVVDAFDLDRQRQLVLVRRDNVEHLVMIGGPNDVVIETAIVRATAPASTLAGREKENGIGSPSLSIPAPQPPAAAPISALGNEPTLPGIPPVPPSVEVEQLSQNSVIAPPQRIAEPAPPPAPFAPPTPPSPPPSAVDPAPPEPDLPRPAPAAPPVAGARVSFPPVSQFPRTIPPVPQRPLPTAVPRPGPASPSPTPVPRPPVSRATPLPIARGMATPQPPTADRVEPNVVIPSAAPPANQAGPGSPLRDRPSEGSESNGMRSPALAPSGREADPSVPPASTPDANATPRRIDPVKRDQPLAPAVPVTPPRPQPAAIPKTPSARTLESLGSLEEEMAKLLGRPVQSSDRSDG